MIQRRDFAAVLTALLLVALACRAVDAFLVPRVPGSIPAVIPPPIAHNGRWIIHANEQPNMESVSPVEEGSNDADDGGELATMSKEEGKRYRETLLRLAEWSLEDYKWRSSVFKSNEADRMVEETIARMQGTDPTYVRPMDASEEKIGPLGRWEKSAVDWLAEVIDEEGRRAKQIIALDGRLIRPIESDQLGPLGMLEQRVIDFLRSIRSSEKARVQTKTLRPMDLEESLRGPLGKMEEAVSQFFKEIRESEYLRLKQSQARGGVMVRPIDVPGPLGELELWIGEVLKAEELRAMELNQTQGITLLRPKDAKVPGPLGETEQKAFEFLDRLSEEEMERLRNIENFLRETRPMETNRDSILGVVEAVAVGIIRSPLMFLGVIDRVRELMYSEPLDTGKEVSTKTTKRNSDIEIDGKLE